MKSYNIYEVFKYIFVFNPNKTTQISIWINMKTLKFKILTYLIIALFAGFITGSCEDCDDGNNFEDQETSQSIDTLSIVR